MPEHDFYERRLIEYYIPELVRLLTELNGAIDKLNTHYETVMEKELESLGNINKRIQERMQEIHSIDDLHRIVED